MADQDTQYIAVEEDTTRGIGPISEDLPRNNWSSELPDSVLWAGNITTAVVCVVISKQGAIMCHYGTEPEIGDELDPDEDPWLAKAKLAFEYIQYHWEEDDEPLKDKFEDARLFVFVPNLGDHESPRIRAINELRAELKTLFEPLKWHVVEYTLTVAIPRAQIEVCWDNSETLPRVVLNSKQVPPRVPGYDEAS